STRARREYDLTAGGEESFSLARPELGSQRRRSLLHCSHRARVVKAAHSRSLFECGGVRPRYLWRRCSQRCVLRQDGRTAHRIRGGPARRRVAEPQTHARGCTLALRALTSTMDTPADACVGRTEGVGWAVGGTERSPCATAVPSARWALTAG